MISEFMADNESTFADRDGDFSDWIEIHNPTDATQSLDGWYLTGDDDNLDRWRFPDVSVKPGGYLIVFASNKNLTDPADELHTNFQLDADGEYLALVRPDGVTVQREFAPEFPSLDDDISYGLFQNTITLVSGDEPIRYRVPMADDDPFLGFVADTAFSVDRGYYDAPFDVGITTATPDATIIYTLDGTPPAVDSRNDILNGMTYSGPLTISTTTNLRALALQIENSVP